MIRKLRFIIVLLTINMGWSQYDTEQFQDFDEDQKAIALTLLNNNEATIAKLIEEYNSIQEDGFLISPNPAKDKLNIKLLSAHENVKLEVFDVLGKLIYKGEITQLESSLNIANWKSGVYLVRVSDTNITLTKRFIKQ